MHLGLQGPKTSALGGFSVVTVTTAHGEREREKGEEHWRGAIGRKRTLRMKNTEEEHQGAVLGSRGSK